MQTAEEFMWGGLRPRLERWSTVHPRSLAQHFAVAPPNAVTRPPRGVRFAPVSPALRRIEQRPYPARAR